MMFRRERFDADLAEEMAFHRELEAQLLRSNPAYLTGRYRGDFWIGMILSFLGGLLPWLGILNVVSTQIGAAGAPLALVGLILFENAYVQAGQSVPLA